MIRTKKINNVSVCKLPIEHVDIKKTKGYKMFPEIYSNIFIVARKRSGKTNLIYNIIKKTTDKDTEIHIFCSTCLKDRAWIEIIKYLEKKGYVIYTHTSIYGEDGENLVQQFMDENNKEDSEEDEEIIENNCSYIKIQNDIEEEEEDLPKKRKKKYISPEHLLIFDDISTELKDRRLNALYKQNRHYRSKIITSTQNLNDILPESRKQQDVWVLMKGLNKEKLDVIYRDADISTSYPLFKTVYDYATNNPYSFLYINTRDDTFRKNFDEMIEIKEDI